MLTPITVTGTLINPDGSVGSGGMSFQLSTLVAGLWVPTGMADSSSGQIVEPTPVQAVVYQGKLLVSPAGGGPYRPLTLLAVDDPTTVPGAGVLAYTVTEQLVSGSLPAWQFRPSHSAVGLTVDISSQRPVP